MNWVSYLARALQVAPYVVYGIEQLARELPGTQKKQLALSALGLAANTAGAIAPEQKQVIDIATQAVSQVIDATVAIANATGDFHKQAPATPPPA